MMLEAVTVTGEKIERSLRDTASSVSIFDAATNESRPGLDTAKDILDRIPNITTTGTGNHAPVVRGVDGTGTAEGVDAFFAGTRPRLNIQIDGRPARDRTSVVEGKSVSVRVELGGRRVIKKKKK